MTIIPDKMLALLDPREFVSIATVSPDGQPNSVPKFFLRAKGSHLYLIDHVMGRTSKNLVTNPFCSVSFMDLDSLEAYRFNGKARLLRDGEIFAAALKEWNDKLIKLSTDRVIEAVTTGKKRSYYEMEIPQKLVVIRITVEGIVKIGRKGEIWRENT